MSCSDIKNYLQINKLNDLFCLVHTLNSLAPNEVIYEYYYAES